MIRDPAWEKLQFEFNELEIDSQVGLYNEYGDGEILVHHLLWDIQRANRQYWDVKDTVIQRMVEYSDYIFAFGPDSRDIEDSLYWPRT